MLLLPKAWQKIFQMPVPVLSKLLEPMPYMMALDRHSTRPLGWAFFDEISERELVKIEDFFIQRKAKVFHEVSPLAEASLMPLLNQRAISL